MATYINGISVKEMTGEHGTYFAVSFSEKFIDEYNKHKNEKGYLNTTFSKRKSIGTYGETHSVTLYVKNSKPENHTNNEESKPDEENKGDLPF